MHKIGIVHIHSDVKFIDNNMARYEGDSFDNTLIIIGPKGHYGGRHRDHALHFGSSPRDLAAIVDHCRTADLVVLYDLTFEKSLIANRLPPDVRIAWRFFGYELYRRMPGDVFSERSLEYHRNRRIGLRTALAQLGKRVRWRTTPGRAFRAGMTRIDFFFGLLENEYASLLEYWPDLPEFVRLPMLGTELSSSADRHVPGQAKKNHVIMGNSRSAYNNHLDILDIISAAGDQVAERFTWYLFFSYGPENGYTRAVRERARDLEQVVVVEDFLPLDEFRGMYKHASAFVMNGYRQMAMANIFEALLNGAKVYLNPRNVVFHWLRNEDLIVHSVDDLAADVAGGKLLLGTDEMEHNIMQFTSVAGRYGIKEFQADLRERLAGSVAAAGGRGAR